MTEGIKYAWGNKPKSDEEGKANEPIASLMEIMEEQKIIATGKESAVLHALLDTDGDSSRKKVVGSGMATKNGAVEEVEEEQEGGGGQQIVGPSADETAEHLAPPAERQKMPTAAARQTHFAVKVYRATLAGFRNRAEYVKDDFRFKNPRRVMKIWAEKEFLNLKSLTSKRRTKSGTTEQKAHLEGICGQ
ncbi:hypothetical protein niasHT_029518 [Heterodera trifolii]|uniref:non-specific serine/threonine protein kinase n=1 Tax=Heterodera trifolii TaxID=157864 RepID=A0ABD2JAW3_9BILA